MQVEGVERMRQQDARLAGMQVVACATLLDALREALGPVVDTYRCVRSRLHEPRYVRRVHEPRYVRRVHVPW